MISQCPQCLQYAMGQDPIALLHLRCGACGCIVIPSTGGPLFSCATCGRKRCPFRQAGVGLAHCKRWRSKVVRPAVDEPELFEEAG